jgi:hypothetical protein
VPIVTGTTYSRSKSPSQTMLQPQMQASTRTVLDVVRGHLGVAAARAGRRVRLGRRARRAAGAGVDGATSALMVMVVVPAVVVLLTEDVVLDVEGREMRRLDMPLADGAGVLRVRGERGRGGGRDADDVRPWARSEPSAGCGTGRG